MTNLYEPLPAGLEVGGRFCAMNTSFRVWLRAERVMADTELPQTEQIALLISLCYREPEKCCTAAHLDALLRFYRGGREADPDDSARTTAPVYDFEQDADYIYAAFLQVYGVDLFETDLHWWAFRAMFAALPEGCAMSRIMSWRAADTRDMPRGQRKFYRRMQSLYALKPKNAAKRKMTLADRDRMWLEKVNKAYEGVKS